MRTDELHGVFVAKVADRLRVGVVLMVVGAGEDVDVDVFRRNQDRDLRVSDRVHVQAGATIGQIQIDAAQRAFGRLEDIAVLPEPPNRDRAFRNGKGSDFCSSDDMSYIIAVGGAGSSGLPGFASGVRIRMNNDDRHHHDADSERGVGEDHRDRPFEEAERRDHKPDQRFARDHAGCRRIRRCFPCARAALH